MFRVLRYCYSCVVGGLIGMLAGMVGQIYIYEFSDRNAVLMQAASVFNELDELSWWCLLQRQYSCISVL